MIWEALLVYEVLVFVLIAIKARRTRARYAALGGRSLLMIMYRDGEYLKHTPKA